MACRNLPQKVRMKGIVLGTLGAVVIRILATLIIVWLLKLPGLMLGGGLLLIYIGYKLLAKPDSSDGIQGKDSLLSAVITVIVADAAMGVDNILAIAGASHGSYPMVIIGLCISIPIMVFGSTLIMKLMDRFPVVMDIGAALIAYTAGKMIADEPFIKPFFEQYPVAKYALIALIVAGVLVLGHWRRRKTAAKRNAAV
ncbi:MAG: YjbE family putative metal transport protein, partial [Clostridiales Family XIII bacterium]|jgi:YjbE family integral membrane protein|nr:YjbE family putative metal transport protein [Clostridiales Family XIII bacterium]